MFSKKPQLVTVPKGKQFSKSPTNYVKKNLLNVHKPKSVYKKQISNTSPKRKEESKDAIKVLKVDLNERGRKQTQNQSMNGGKFV